MINIYIVLSIILIHWIADFIVQTHWQASNKSINNSALLQHTITYSLCWVIPSLILLNMSVTPSIIFVIITFIIHTITDYYTSKANKILWERNEIHNFFVSIGFDQVLHYIQLFLTFYLLKYKL